MKGYVRIFAWPLLAGALLLPTPAVVGQDAAKDLKTAGLYKSKCALCHSDDGSGSSVTGKQLGAKDLKSDEIQKMSDDELMAAISKGKGKMPAFGGKLTDAQIKSLILQIRHFASK